MVMDKKIIFVKTGKGESEVKAQGSLSGDVRRALLLIDDRSTFEEVSKRAAPSLRSLLPDLFQELISGGYIRDKDKPAVELQIATPKISRPAVKAEAEGEDLDFTSMASIPAPPAPAAGSQKLAEAEAQARQAALQKEQAEAQARQQAEARQRAEHEAFQAKQQAEAIRLQAQQAAVKVKAELEAAAKAKAEAEAARIKAEQDAARVKAELEAAKAKAEQEARALAEQRARQEQEAKALAEQKARQEQEAERLRAEQEAARQQAEQEAKARAEAEQRAQAEAKAKQEAEAARLKAEREAEAARRLAEQEAARLKAEQEAARIKAELEAAKAKAEREARERAEAKAREEAEAIRKKVEAEAAAARQQAEQEAARAKAELEAAARAKAEAEARAKAEALAKQQAEAARLKAEQEAAKAKAELAAAKAKAEAEARAQAEERARQENARLQAEQEAAHIKAELEASAKARQQAEAEVRVLEAARQRQIEESETVNMAVLEIKLDAFDLGGAVQAEPVKNESAPRKVETPAEPEIVLMPFDVPEAPQPEPVKTVAPPAVGIKPAAAETQPAPAEVHAVAASLKVPAEPVPVAEPRPVQAPKPPVESPEAKRKAEEEARLLAEEQAKAWAEAERRAQLQAKAEAGRQAQKPDEAVVAPAASIKKVEHRARAPLPWGKIAGGLALLALVVLIALPYVWPLDEYRAPLEQRLSAQLQRPVKIGALQAASLPPTLELQQVTVGEAGELGIDKVVLHFNLPGLLSSTKPIDDAVLQGVDIQTAVLEQGVSWLQSASGLAGFPIRHLTLDGVTLANDELALPKMMGDVELRGAGELGKAMLHSEDGKIDLSFEPVQGQWQVALNFKGGALPLLPQIEFAELSASGVLTQGGVHFTSVDARAFDGILQGELKLSWRKGWQVQGRGVAKMLELAALAPHNVITGQVDGTFDVGMQAGKLAVLGKNPQLEGEFTAVRGVISGMDMVETARLLSRQHMVGGRTHFDELSGRFALEDHRVRFRSLKIVSGMLHGTGSLDVDSGKQVSGNFDVEIKMRAGTTPLRLTGTLQEFNLRVNGG